MNSLKIFINPARAKPKSMLRSREKTHSININQMYSSRKEDTSANTRYNHPSVFLDKIGTQQTPNSTSQDIVIPRRQKKDPKKMKLMLKQKLMLPK